MRRPNRRPSPLLLLAALFHLALALAVTTHAQRIGAGGDRGPHTLFGDIKVEGLEVAGTKAPTFDVVLHTLSGNVISRQTVPNNGRYRFMDLHNGFYDVSVSSENREITRIRVHVDSLYKTDFRQDIELEASASAATGGGRAATVSAADSYARAPANQSLFDKAQSAMDGKKYDQAVAHLGQLVAADAKDFQAWSELGTAHLLQKKEDEAEKAYRRALAERPTFGLALLNLGRLLASQKKYEAAIEPLTKAVESQPTSAEANFLLGETYLQLKRGSKAVSYLNEAVRLDPQGKADVHLRLAALYNAAGMKDKAASEYEQFLTKKPDHPDKKKLQQYISENKKQ